MNLIKKLLLIVFEPRITFQQENIVSSRIHEGERQYYCQFSDRWVYHFRLMINKPCTTAGRKLEPATGIFKKDLGKEAIVKAATGRGSLVTIIPEATHLANTAERRRKYLERVHKHLTQPRKGKAS